MNERITQMLEEIEAQICDEYCKYAYQITEEEDLYLICETCPLNRL